jgi:hypothetical protein
MTARIAQQDSISQSRCDFNFTHLSYFAFPATAYELHVLCTIELKLKADELGAKHVTIVCMLFQIVPRVMTKASHSQGCLLNQTSADMVLEHKYTE